MNTIQWSPEERDDVVTGSQCGVGVTKITIRWTRHHQYDYGVVHAMCHRRTKKHCTCTKLVLAHFSLNSRNSANPILQKCSPRLQGVGSVITRCMLLTWHHTMISFLRTLQCGIGRYLYTCFTLCNLCCVVQVWWSWQKSSNQPCRSCLKIRVQLIWQYIKN